MTGMGVTIYTLDSGIMASHQEFQSLIYPGDSRASEGEAHDQGRRKEAE